MDRGRWLLSLDVFRKAGLARSSGNGELPAMNRPLVPTLSTIVVRYFFALRIPIGALGGSGARTTVQPSPGL